MEIEKLVRKNIQELMPYSSARSEYKGMADIFLDANENPFPTGYNRYPDPLQWQLKERIGRMKGIPKERIFLGNGSDEVIDLLIRIFCEPREDHIITLPPTYGMYRVSAGVADVAVKEVSLTAAFQPNVKTILRQSDEHAKLLFLCSPNNPTANSFERDRIESLLREFPGIVVIDEAYIDFSARQSTLELLPEHSNLVVMQTFSKAWGMAGIRLGMAFASENIIALFNKVKPPYNVNQLTQEHALNALENEHQKAEWVRKVLGQRAVLQQFLVGLDFVEHLYPSDANFLLVKMTEPEAVYKYLVERKIIVRDRSKVHLCEGCLRITVGASDENEKLFQALLEY